VPESRPSKLLADGLNLSKPDQTAQNLVQTKPNQGVGLVWSHHWRRSDGAGDNWDVGTAVSDGGTEVIGSEGIRVMYSKWRWSGMVEQKERDTIGVDGWIQSALVGESWRLFGVVGWQGGCHG
jgi:hypothetical protein